MNSEQNQPLEFTYLMKMYLFYFCDAVNFSEFCAIFWTE